MMEEIISTESMENFDLVFTLRRDRIPEVFVGGKQT
jgi:hypothetical protein